MTNLQSQTPTASVRQKELIAILALTLVAAGLRLYHLDRAVIEHFDEGVYAANFYASRLDDQFPNRHLYAPPLLPLLIEYSIVLGRGLHAAMWVNLAAGILLTPALWWVGRSWFGPIAGVTAAGLCTFSDVHLLYSRTALTDPLLTFFLVLAVYMIWRAICQGGIFIIVVSSLLVAAAWWTKYNGWLPLAITAAGLAGWLLWGVLPSSFVDDEPASRTERRQVGQLSRRKLCSVLVPRALFVLAISIACWVPYVIKLQETGGYAAVAANHARYVGGLANWPSAFLAQARSLHLLEGPVTVFGTLAAAGLSLLAVRCARSVRVRAPHPGPLPHSDASTPKGGSVVGERESMVVATQTWVMCAFLALALTAWLGSAAVLLIAGAWVMWQVFTARSMSGRNGSVANGPVETPESNLAGWLLIAWFIGLFVTTPLYQPYSRLALPWLASGWLMAGLTVSLLSSRTEAQPGHVSSKSRILLWPIIAAGTAILIWQAPHVISRGVSGWQDRTGIQQIAPQIVEAAMEAEPDFEDNGPDDADAVFYVLAEPAVFVHLSAISIDSPLNYIAQPASTLRVTTLTEDPGFDVYLIVGPHELSDEAKLNAIENISLVASFPYQPSKLVWLDELPGRPYSDWKRDDSRWQLRLYRVLPQ